MTDDIKPIIANVHEHDFHPLDDRAFTIDRHLNTAGIADRNDRDWYVRTRAVRDLVRAGDDDRAAIRAALEDTDPHARTVAAHALGVLGDPGAVTDLERVARSDESAVARSRAVVSLGQLARPRSAPTLETVATSDPSRDVRHQASLASHRVETNQPATHALEDAWRTLELVDRRPVTGDVAPSFSLSDAFGTEHSIEDIRGDGWAVLIWIFADWCPVCHGEFAELLEHENAFATADVRVATIECHDAYRCRAMLGTEAAPEYWFDATPRNPDEIWWPHLVDRAAAVGTQYGVDPHAFAVHAEYVNRPATVIVDPDGVIRFNYTGTFWGDRPSIPETLSMIEEESFEFEHPDRLVPEEGC